MKKKFKDCFIFIPLTYIPRMPCNGSYVISTSYEYMLKMDIQFTNMIKYKRLSDCSQKSLHSTTLFNRLMADHLDVLQIFDTDIKQNRLGLYCLGGETRNISYYSDWNSMLLTIRRHVGMRGLYIISLYWKQNLSETLNGASRLIW